MMTNGMILEDNMSNLTSASNHEASISSSTRNEVGTTLYTQQQSPIASPNQPPPSKKKRNLPGNPDPASEVVALSPTTLMATNRFICEICSKGFQRDQNLQLHRRGHNLPWKLKQRTNEEVVKKKVYVCPETTCVHHEPSRALGDLTGIKKHFSRKHGEKKWKCEKCSKRYAVQSDWKAHSKICGTREYRCDCGTLFSRRDSFTTHRAFCDALTEETTRSTNLTQNHSLPSPISSSHFSHLPLIKPEQDQTHFPPWLAHQPNPGPNPMASPSPNPTLSLPSFPQPTAPPHMSATALLQKAAQMGVTMTKPTTTTITAGSGLMGLSSCEDGLLFGNISKVGVSVTSGCMEQVGATMLSGFEEALMNGMLVNPKTHFSRGNEGGSGVGGEGLTRDFLGLRGFSHVGFPNMGGFDQMNSSSSTSYGRQVNQNQAPWQG